MNSDRQIYMNAVMAGGNYGNHGNHGMGYTTVPMGWNRTFWGDGSVVYVSPSGHLLHCAEDLQRYLLAEGTCKCGLECPLIIDRVFNFNPRVPARPKLPADVLAESQLGSLCKHRHNLVAMAEALQGNEESLANTCHPGGSSVFGRSKGSKRTRSKSKPEPGIDFKHLNASSSQYIALQGGHMHPFPGIASFMPSMDSAPFDHRLQQHSIESRQRQIQMHMLQMQHQELMQQHQHMQHQLHHQHQHHQQQQQQLQQQNPMWRGNLEIESVLHSPVEKQPVEQRGGKHCHLSPPSSCINQSFPQRSASVQQDASASASPHCAAPGSSKSPRPIGELTSPVAKDRQLIHGHGSLPFGFHVEPHPAHGEAQPPGINPDACTPNVIPLLSNMYHAPNRASLSTANISNNPVLLTNQSDIALFMQDGSKESSVGLEKASVKVPTSKPTEDVAKHGRKSPEGTLKDGNLSPTVSKATTMHTSCTKPEKTFSTGNISLQQIFKQSIEGSAFPASSLLTAAARAQLAKHPQSPDSPSPRHAGDLMSGMGLFKELPPNVTTKEPKLLLGASHGGGTAISSANQKLVAQSSNPSDIVNVTERTEDTSPTHKIGESPIQCLENAVQNLKDEPKASRACASTSAVSSQELTQVSFAGRKRLSLEGVDSAEGSAKRQRLQSGDSSHGRASVECEIIHSEAALLTPQVPEITTNKHSSMHHQDTTKVTGSYSVVCSTGKPRNTNKHSAVDNAELARWQQQQQEWYANTLRAKQQHGAGNIPIEHLPPGAVMGQPSIRSRGLQELQYIALGGNPSQRMSPRQQHPNMGHMHRFPNRFMNPLFNSHATMHQGHGPHGMPMPYRMDLPADALDQHISQNPNMCNSTILQSMLQQQQLQQLGLLPPGNFHQVPHMNPGQHVDPSQQTDMPNLPQAHGQAALKAGTSSPRRKGSRSASASAASAPVSDLDEEEPKDAAYWVKAASKLGGVKKVKDILAMTRSLKKHNSEAGEVEAIFQAVLDSASGGMKVIIKEGTRSQPAAQSKSTDTDQGKGSEAKPPEHSIESLENSDSSCDVFEKVTDDSEKQTQPSQLEQSDDTQSVKDAENIPTADVVQETDRDSSNVYSVTETELPELPADHCTGEQAGSDSIDEVESATHAAMSSEQTQDENPIQEGNVMEPEGSSQALIQSQEVPTPDHDELDSEHDAILEQKSNPTVGEEGPVSDLPKVEPSPNNSPTESASCLEPSASASQMPIEHGDGLQNIRSLVAEHEDNEDEPVKSSSDTAVRENITEIHLDDTKSICQTTAVEDKSLSPSGEDASLHEPELIPAEVKTDATFDQSCVEEEAEPSTISGESLDRNTVDTESDTHVLPEQHVEITSATPDRDVVETSVQPVQSIEYTHDQVESSDPSATMVSETHSNTDTNDPTCSALENTQDLPESTGERPNSVGPLSNTALVEGESLSSSCLTEEPAHDTEDAGSSEHQIDEHVTSEPSQENTADQQNEPSQTTVLVSEDLVISTDTECDSNIMDHAQIDSEPTKQDIAEDNEQAQADSFKDPTTQDATSDEQTMKQDTMMESESVDQPSEPMTQNQQTECESVEQSIDDEPMEQDTMPDSKSVDVNQASDGDQVMQDEVTDNQQAEQTTMLQNDESIITEPIAQDEDVHIPVVKENTEIDNEQGNESPPMEDETAKQSQPVSSEAVKEMNSEPVRLDHAIDAHPTEHETTVDLEPDKENQIIHHEPTKQVQEMASESMNYEDTMDTQTVGPDTTDDSQPAKQEQQSNSEPTKEDQVMDIESVTLEENTENREIEQNLSTESESMPDDVTESKEPDGPHETGFDTTCTVDSEPVKQHPLMDIEPETEEMEESQQTKNYALENIAPDSHSLPADDEPEIPNEIVDDQEARQDTLLNSEPVSEQVQPMDTEPMKPEEPGSQQLQHNAIVDREPVKQDEPMDSEPVKFKQAVDSHQVDNNAATDRGPVNQDQLIEGEPVKCDQVMDDQNVEPEPSADSDLVEHAQQIHSAPVEHPDEEMDSLQQECDAMVDREAVKQVPPQECEPVKIEAMTDNQDEQDPSVDSGPVNPDQPVIKCHIEEELLKQDESGECESLDLGQNESQTQNQDEFPICELNTAKPEQSPSASTEQGKDSQSSNLSSQAHQTDGELDKRNPSENMEQEQHDVIRQECREDSQPHEVAEDLSGNSQTLKDDQEPQTSEPHQSTDWEPTEQDDVLMLVEPLSPDGNKPVIEDQSTTSSINLPDSSTNTQAQLDPDRPVEESLSDVHRHSDENLNNNRSTSDEDVTCVDNTRSNTSSICLDFQSEDDTSDVLLLDLDTLGNEEANPEPFPEQERVSVKELSKSPHAAESQSLETAPPEVLHASRNSLDDRDSQTELRKSQDDSTMNDSESVIPRDRLQSEEGSSPQDVRLDTSASSEVRSEDLPVALNGPLSTSPNPSEQETKSEIMQSQPASPPSDSFKDRPTTQEEHLSKEEGITPNGVLESSSFEGSPVDSQINQSQCLQGLTQECTTKEEKRSGLDDERENRENKPLTDEPPVQETVRRETNLKRGISETQKGVLSAKEAGFKRERLVQEAPTRVLRGNVRTEPSPEFSSSMFPRHLEIGDLVWGPIRGHPSWPGKLVSETEVRGRSRREEGKMWVRWFGDHSCTQVEPEKLKTLSEGLEAHHSARQSNRSRGLRINSTLEAAIQEAMNELDKKMEQAKDTKTKPVPKTTRPKTRCKRLR